MCRTTYDGGRRCPNQHERSSRERRDDAVRQRLSRYNRRVNAIRRSRPGLDQVIRTQLVAPTGVDVVTDLRLRRRAALRAGDAVAYELLSVRIDAAQLALARRDHAELRMM